MREERGFPSAEVLVGVRLLGEAGHECVAAFGSRRWRTAALQKPRSDGVAAGDDFSKLRELGRRYEAVKMLFCCLVD